MCSRSRAHGPTVTRACNLAEPKSINAKLGRKVKSSPDEMSRPGPSVNRTRAIFAGKYGGASESGSRSRGDLALRFALGNRAFPSNRISKGAHFWGLAAAAERGTRKERKAAYRRLRFFRNESFLPPIRFPGVPSVRETVRAETAVQVAYKTTRTFPFDSSRSRLTR